MNTEKTTSAVPSGSLHSTIPAGCVDKCLFVKLLVD